MTADVYVFPGPAATPPLLPERRKLLLDWLAVQVTGGFAFVPEDVIDTMLDAHACPDLTPGQREEFWDGVKTWVNLRQQAIERTGHPEDVLGRPGSTEDAEDRADRNAQDALSLLVFGNQSTARGGHSPRGTSA